MNDECVNVHCRKSVAKSVGCRLGWDSILGSTPLMRGKPPCECTLGGSDFSILQDRTQPGGGCWYGCERHARYAKA
eukprot:1145666-Pelagomonas_calceolata.AAC.5